MSPHRHSRKTKTALMKKDKRKMMSKSKPTMMVQKGLRGRTTNRTRTMTKMCRSVKMHLP
jgi:hypothetical protein